MTKKKEAYLKFKKIIDQVVDFIELAETLSPEELEWIAKRLTEKGYKEKMDNLPNSPFKL